MRWVQEMNLFQGHYITMLHQRAEKNASIKSSLRSHKLSSSHLWDSPTFTPLVTQSLFGGLFCHKSTFLPHTAHCQSLVYIFQFLWELDCIHDRSCRHLFGGSEQHFVYLKVGPFPGLVLWVTVWYIQWTPWPLCLSAPFLLLKPPPDLWPLSPPAGPPASKPNLTAGQSQHPHALLSHSVWSHSPSVSFKHIFYLVFSVYIHFFLPKTHTHITLIITHMLTQEIDFLSFF